MKTTGPALLFLSALTVTSSAFAQGQPVTALVDASKVNSPISPYLYGQFIEHAGNIINDTLWAEMLDDRKFYYAVQPKPAETPAASGAPSRRRTVGMGRWNPIGPVDSVVMDTVKPFVGEHTPLVKLAAGEPRGIRQTDVSFVANKAYTGHVELAGDPTARVALNVVWGSGSDAVKQSIPLGNIGVNYRKLSFSFKAKRSGSAQFEIVGTGTGSFHIGVVSLMAADNIDGFRPDSIAALKSLHSGVYRFPGGNFVSAHEWRDAIGELDKRPPIFDPVWRAVQPNDVGTDEFMTLCKLLEVEPYITVNAGTGDAHSAAEYVEYTNGSANTPMGKLRAANGHAKPYGVKFWGIGNEMWGISYQYGAMKPAQFAYKHNQFAKAMRKVDPSVVLIATGAMPDTMTGSKESLNLGTDLVPKYLSPGDWSGMLFSNCFDNFDLMSDHYYNFGGTHFSLAEARQVPNDPKEPVTDWMRRPANHIRIKYEEYKEYEKLFPQLVTHPKPLNIDEWAYSGTADYPVYPSFAWMFHEMFRHTDIFHMAAYTFATSLLNRDGATYSLNSNAQVFKLYQQHFGTLPVNVSGNSPQPKPLDPPGGEQPVVNAGSDTFPLDVAAAWTADRKTLTVAVVNPTETQQSIQLKFSGANFNDGGTQWRLASTEPKGQNPTISRAPLDGVPSTVTVPGFSVTIYQLASRR